VHAQESVRFGIKCWLEQAGVAKVVLEMDGPLGLLAAMPPEGVQVLLLHVGLTLQLALDTVQAVQRRFAGTAVLLVGEWTGPMVGRAVEVDLHGLLHSAGRLVEVEQAVRVAAQGSLHLNPLMREQLRGRRRPAAKAAAPITLTTMQAKVLRLVCRADELTYAQIAGELQLGVRTVHSHRDNLFKRFGVNTRGKLKAKAQSLGML
jgi:DNA-binding NarL/FixJ family response regulator